MRERDIVLRLYSPRALWRKLAGVLRFKTNGAKLLFSSDLMESRFVFAKIRSKIYSRWKTL